jgi:hypothetical protein
MKRSYSTFTVRIKDAARSRGVSPEELFQSVCENYESILATKFDSSLSEILIDDGVGVYAIYIELLILQKKAVHLFLPGLDFCEWLISCVPVLEPNHAAALQQMLGVHVPGVLHFPTASKKISMAFLIPKSSVPLKGNSNKEFNALITTASKEGKSFGLNQFLVSLEGSDKGSDAARWYAKLIVGLGMYCNCFPETLRDGPPEDLKHPSFHQYESSKTIGISEKVFCFGTHESPVAHFRRGHFRILRSEKFKNKRFQAVFVKETFVNGKSKTVLSPEECQAI